LVVSVSGANFTTSSQVQWNGATLATTYVSNTRLTATIPATNMASATVASVTVTDPTLGVSGAVSFSVNYPAPQLASISPTQALAGGPAFTLTATGSSFTRASSILWNGTALPTTYVSATQLTATVPATDIASVASATISVSTPTPGGGASSGLQLSIVAAATSLSTLPIAAGDIAWDAQHGLLVASVPGASGSVGTLVAVDPLTGSQIASQAAGITPNLLSIASDDSAIWVGEDGSGAVQGFALPSLTPGARATLPSSGFGKPSAVALKTAPDSPATVAILVGTASFPYSSSGLYIADGSQFRTTSTGNTTSGITGLEWSANSSTLYGNQGEYGTFGLNMLAVNSAGVSVAGTYPYVFNIALAGMTHIHLDAATGYLYGDDGRVVDPATGNIVGNFNLDSLYMQVNYSTHCVVDAANNRVYFLGQSLSQYDNAKGFSLLSFDKTTYRFLSALALPQATGNATNFIRWGKAGLAFNTFAPQYSSVTPAIYLVDGNWVSSSTQADITSPTLLSQQPHIASLTPQSVTAGAAATTLTVNGSGFASDATILWNGTALATTVLSSAQLQATVPTSSLATAASTTVTVSSASTGLAAMNTLRFTIGDAASGLAGMNLSSLSVAWDATSQLLYAGTMSSDPAYPNALVAIDPTSRQVARSAYAGPDPFLTRTSADGKYAYVTTKVANAATQLQLPGLTSPVTWYLGASANQGPLIAVDLQPSPVSSATTAISTGTIVNINNVYNSFEPMADGRLTLYDNNQPRSLNVPYIYPTNYLFGTLQWAPDGKTLYAADNETTTFNLYALDVSNSGLTLKTYAAGAVGNATLSADPSRAAFNFFANLRLDAGTGYLYDDNGLVIDPASGSQLGAYSSWGLAAADSSLNRVFILRFDPSALITSSNGCASYTINSFNQKQLIAVGSLTINICGTPTSIVRWGNSGLAITTYLMPMDNPGSNGMLYLIDDAAFVSAN